MSQNDLKKGLGICAIKLGHTWEKSAETTVKTSINSKDAEYSMTADVTKRFMKG